MGKRNRARRRAEQRRSGRDGHDRLQDVARLLTAAVGQAAQRGWSRDDVRHVVARRLSTRHAACPPLGDEPFADVDVAEAVRLAVETLALLARLPDVAPAGDRDPAALDGAGRLDPRVIRRVRALLSKAESTEFPDEAEALTAKAQELIARHAIAALTFDGTGDGGPTSRRVYFDDPYVDAKSALLGGVARANRCSTVFTPGFAWSTAFGFPADLDVVELLFESLLVQAVHTLAREGSRTDVFGRSRTRSFRRSFLFGFAHRIGQRLADTTQAQVDDAAGGDAALLPVLAARDERVRVLQEATFPLLTERSTSVSNAAGWAAGQAAAEVADLSVGKRRVPRGGAA